MTADGPRVIVAGGSLGGLNAALFLRGAGCSVEVYERSRTPLEGLGAGIVLNPATVRYLVGHDVVSLGEISVATEWLRYLDDDGIAAEIADPHLFTSFDSLYRNLLKALGTEHHHLAHEVVSAEQDADGVTVRFADGGEARADLVVFADGIGSAGRRQLLPDVRPEYAGYVAWRGTVAPGDVARETAASFEDAITYTVLDPEHTLVYPIPAPGGGAGGERLLNWLWYTNVPEGPELDAFLTDRDGTRRFVSLPAGFVPEDRIAALREAAGRALPRAVADVVTATEQPFIQVVFDVEVPRMAVGRIALVGDAAFAARPHAAAGSAKAAEDGYRLGAAMAEAGGDVTRALELWEPGQLALGRRLVERARRAGRAAQFDRTLRAGDPLPFGLYESGDSVMRLP
jgi:2,6-dihydroxypyridine 3-monooxygenase